jgi:hypothetical protein
VTGSYFLAFWFENVREKNNLRDLATFTKDCKKSKNNQNVVEILEEEASSKVCLKTKPIVESERISEQKGEIRNVELKDQNKNVQNHTSFNEGLLKPQGLLKRQRSKSEKSHENSKKLKFHPNSDNSVGSKLEDTKHSTLRHGYIKSMKTFFGYKVTC